MVGLQTEGGKRGEAAEDSDHHDFPRQRRREEFPSRTRERGEKADDETTKNVDDQRPDGKRLAVFLSQHAGEPHAQTRPEGAPQHHGEIALQHRRRVAARLIWPGAGSFRRASSPFLSCSMRSNTSASAFSLGEGMGVAICGAARSRARAFAEAKAMCRNSVRGIEKSAGINVFPLFEVFVSALPRP
jgi:hypothetical protein